MTEIRANGKQPRYDQRFHWNLAQKSLSAEKTERHSDRDILLNALTSLNCSISLKAETTVALPVLVALDPRLHLAQFAFLLFYSSVEHGI